jgi:hypothetical protein
MSRIGSWFRRGPRPGNGDFLIDHPTSDGGTGTETTRAAIVRRMSKREQSIAMQEGFNALTNLMSTIKDNLSEQGRRQDELLKYLSHLPQVLQSIPESARVQGETLRALHARLEQQNEQQQLIAEVLNKVADTGSEQRKTVEEMRDRVQTMADQDARIADNMSSVGAAMQTVSRNSQASAQVLEQLRDNINNRDGQLERILHRQAARFTALLVVAVFLSIAALGAVAIIGYQVMNRPAASNGPAVTTAAPSSPAPEIRAAP